MPGRWPLEQRPGPASGRLRGLWARLRSARPAKASGATWRPGTPVSGAPAPGGMPHGAVASSDDERYNANYRRCNGLCNS